MGQWDRETLHGRLHLLLGQVKWHFYIASSTGVPKLVAELRVAERIQRLTYK
jgi:hypothetical protein